MENLTEKMEDLTEEEERYTLTPWGCLYAVLKDYKIDCDWVSGKVGEHIVEDFMESMERCGYISKVGGKE